MKTSKKILILVTGIAILVAFINVQKFYKEQQNELQTEKQMVEH